VEERDRGARSDQGIRPTFGFTDRISGIASASTNCSGSSILTTTAIFSHVQRVNARSCACRTDRIEPYGK
jgi:hypothetical protein